MLSSRPPSETVPDSPAIVFNTIRITHAGNTISVEFLKDGLELPALAFTRTLNSMNDIMTLVGFDGRISGH